MELDEGAEQVAQETEDGPAAGIEVGAGVRGEERGGRLGGPMVEVAVPLGEGVYVRGIAYVRVQPDVADSLDEVIVAIAAEEGGGDLAVPIVTDRAAIDALFGWQPVPIGRGPGLHGGLGLEAGVSLRLRDEYVASASEGYLAGEDGAEVLDVTHTGMRFVPSPAAGASFDAWVGPTVGLRFRLLGRLSWEERDYFLDAGDDPTRVLTASVAWSLTVVTAW